MENNWRLEKLWIAILLTCSGVTILFCEEQAQAQIIADNSVNIIAQKSLKT